MHETAGLASPTDSSLVVAVRDASKRILGTARSNRKEPITPELLKTIVGGADLSNALELRNVCLYLLCFAGFLRFDDVSRIKRNRISFHSGYMSIKVEKSKNDQLRQGDEVLIAKGEGTACPVRILEEYLNRFNIDPQSDQFIFRRLIKTKKSYKLASNNKPIGYSTFRDHLRKTLRGFVPDPQVYGTHSFRSGGGGHLLRLIVACLKESFKDMVVGSPQPLRMGMLKTAQTSSFRSLSPWVCNRYC